METAGVGVGLGSGLPMNVRRVDVRSQSSLGERAVGDKE